MKRVITGVKDGETIFARLDEPAPEITAAGEALWQLWGCDVIPTVVPNSGEIPASSQTVFPMLGGLRMTLAHFPPGLKAGAPAETAADGGAAVPELDQLFDERGFHQTPTVDFGWILSGELGLELESGAISWLTAGDFVVQNGTRHAWRNRGTVDAVGAFVSLGTRLTE